MMINRHNYEEFFLLYADDELNHQQRVAVELFVQQNPDMAAELEMLQQMKLQPENIVFHDKSLLYKTTDVEININNYEEFFFLYIDRELDETAKGKVEKFVLQHPQLQEEFTLLKQTVLQPEAVMFADKSSLYRKEERRVAYIGFMRMAVAAAVIGIAVLGWWLYPTGSVKPVLDSVGKVTNQPTSPKANLTSPQTIKPAIVTPARNNTQQSTAKLNVKKTQQEQKTITPTVKINNNVQQVPVVVDPKTQDIAFVPLQKHVDSITNIASNVATVKPDNSVAAIKTDPTTTTGSSKGADAGEIKQEGNSRDVIAAVDVIKPIPYRVIDTDDEDRSMYVGSLELNRDKIRGFFKKAGRLFGSRAKKDTD